MSVGEVFADQVVLAGERVVQRALGDPGPGDDAVDADGVDALVVEEVVSRVEDARLRGATALHGARHLSTITAPICLNNMANVSLLV